MKNLKKLLVALLAVAVLVIGVAVFASAADIRPVGDIEIARRMLASVESAGNLTAKAQAMRRLDTYVEDHQFLEDDKDTFLEIEYKDAQEALIGKTVEQTDGFLDIVVNPDTLLEDARELLEGVRGLLGSTDARGYFDTNAEEYLKLGKRVTVAEAILNLRKVTESSALREKGAALKTLVAYMEANTFDQTLPDYQTLSEQYDSVKATVSAQILAEANRLCGEAIDPAATDAESAEKYEQMLSLTSVCYFDADSAGYNSFSMRVSLAKAYQLYRKVLSAPDLLRRAGAFKTLANYKNNTTLDENETEVQTFHTSYNETETQIVADVLVAADEKLRDIAQDGTAAGVLAKCNDLANFLNTCYLRPAESATYARKLEVARCWQPVNDMLAEEDLFARSQKLKANADILESKSFSAADEYENAVLSAYTTLRDDTLAKTWVELKKLGDLATNDEASFGERSGALKELKAKMEICYLDTKADEYTALKEQVAQADAYLANSVKENLHQMLEDALAIEDTDARATALADVHAAVNSYNLSDEDPEIAAFLKQLAYADLDVLVEYAMAAMNDTTGTYDALAAKVRAVNGFITENSDLILSEDAQYNAFAEKFLPVQTAFNEQTEGQLRDLIAEAQTKSGTDLVWATMRVTGFIKMQHFAGITDSARELLAQVQVLEQKAEEYRERVRTERDKTISLSEFTTVPKAQYTFDSAAASKPTFSNNGSTTSCTIDLTNGGYKSAGCVTVRTDAKGKDSFMDLPLNGLTLGCTVLEFDITTFDTLTPYIYLESKAQYTGGGTWWTGFMKMRDGVLSSYDGSKVYQTNAIVPGAWTHLAFAFNTFTYEITAYVNDQKVGSCSIKKDKEFTLPSIRLGTSSASDSSFSVDNIISYYGTAPRTYDRFTSMEKEDYFRYCAGILQTFASDPSKFKATDVKVAYDKALELFATLWDKENNTLKGSESYADQAGLIADCEYFASYDATVLDAALNEVAYTNARKMADELKAIARGAATISTRLGKIAEIKQYLSENSNYLAAGTDAYKEIEGVLNAVQTEIEIDTSALELDKLITNLENARTLNAKRSYINQIGKYDLSVMPDYMASRIASYNKIRQGMETAIRVENTDLFIGTMRKFAEYETVEDALADYENLARFMKLARQVYLSGMYNETARGFSEAKETYDKFAEPFYNRLQQEHVRVLTGYIENYNKAIAFIEKLGITSFMRDYFTTQDIDMNNSSIRTIYDTLLIYEETQDQLQSSYEELLQTNSALFVSIVSRMELVESYQELLALYNEAASSYYYMNVDSDAVQQATAKYTAYGEKLKQWEDASLAFIAKVALIPADANRIQMYRALVNACRAMDGIAPDYNGVSAALAVYNRAAQAYTDGIRVMNTEVTVSTGAMYTVRASFSGVKQAVAAFKKFYD